MYRAKHIMQALLLSCYNRPLSTIGLSKQYKYYAGIIGELKLVVKMTLTVMYKRQNKVQLRFV